ncbi:MAG: hypothetical protein AABX38_01995 [Candidatus Micrarchaeota archaeon]|mgnify:CR=1 FL=1
MVLTETIITTKKDILRASVIVPPIQDKPPPYIPPGTIRNPDLPKIDPFKAPPKIKQPPLKNKIRN